MRVTKTLIIFSLFLLGVGKAQAIDTDGEDLTMMSTPAPTTFSCAGLQRGQTDRMDDDPGDSLFQVPQVNDQDSVTRGIGVPNKDGMYFGSCATFTSIARVVAILYNENLPVPPDFQVTEENIRRFYKAYGDFFNTGKGTGNAQVVTANILQEYKSKYCQSSEPQVLLSQHLNVFNQSKLEPQIECSESFLKFQSYCHPEFIDQYLANPNETKQLKQELRLKKIMISKTPDEKDVIPGSLKVVFDAVAAEFQNNPRLPIEFIHGGNGLNSTIETDIPSIPNRERLSHVSLITGRRLTESGECQILVRNSYQTRCRPRIGRGKQMFTGRDCEGETDSTWFSESHVTRFVGGVRVTDPIHPAAPRKLLAKDQGMKNKK